MKTKLLLIVLGVVMVLPGNVIAESTLGKPLISKTYLEILENGDSEDMYFLKGLNEGKVNSIALAKEIAVSKKLSTLGCVELWEVTDLFKIGKDVSDFARVGDFIWEVRFYGLEGGVTQSIWVNSTTGNTKEMLGY